MLQCRAAFLLLSLLSSAHQPHSARSCGLALRAVGAARGRPGGAPLAWVWGVRGRALTHPRPLVLSGVRLGPASRWPWVRCAGVGARLSLAPCPVPRFVVCCAGLPGSRHPVAVVAWRLSLCPGCGRRRASLACLVAPRWCAAPRPVWSLLVLRSAFPSPWCLPPPRGLSPPALLGGCAGHMEAGREPGSLCLLCLCGVLGHLAPVHRCARSVLCFACAVSWATWLLFTGVHAWFVALRVRCPEPLGSCTPVRPLGALFCLCGVLGHLAPVHQCARSVCCVAMRWPGPLGSCSPVCPLGALLCVCVVLGHLAPFHQCARLVHCVAMRWPGPLGSCSPLCPLSALHCVRGFLGRLAPVHRCARSVRCVACAVSWAIWLLFNRVPARCVVLRVPCRGRLGSCSPVCPLVALLGVCGVLAHLAPVHCCVRSVRCFACALSSATWLLFTGVPAVCVVLCVRCPGLLAPRHRCARLVCCVACTVSWAPWLLFSGVIAWCAVRCAGPLGSCSSVCSLGVLCCGLRVRGVAAGRTLVHPDGGYS